MTTHSARIFGLSPFFELRNNSQARVKGWKMKIRLYVSTFGCGVLVSSVRGRFYFSPFNCCLTVVFGNSTSTQLYAWTVRIRTGRPMAPFWQISTKICEVTRAHAHTLRVNMIISRLQNGLRVISATTADKGLISPLQKCASNQPDHLKRISIHLSLIHIWRCRRR